MEYMASREHWIARKVLRRAVNMVSGLKGTTYEEKLTELDIMTLEERRRQSENGASL
jgi:hypothetical protein